MQKTCIVVAHTSERTEYWPVLSKIEAGQWANIGQYLEEHYAAQEITVLYSESQASNESVAWLLRHCSQKSTVRKCPALGGDDEPGDFELALDCLEDAWDVTPTVVIVTNEAMATLLARHVASVFQHRLCQPLAASPGTGWIMKERAWARFP